jgi:hypothetical protein
MKEKETSRRIAKKSAASSQNLQERKKEKHL